MNKKGSRYGISGRHTRTFHIIVVATLLLSMGVSSTALAQTGPQFTATPLTPESSYSMEKDLTVNAQGMTSVILKLKGSSLSSYKGDIAGFAATSPVATGESYLDVQSAASASYLGYLKAEHDAIKQDLTAVPEAKVTNDLNIVLNAVSVVLPASEVNRLKDLPNVEAVYPDALHHPDTDNSPQFIGAPTVWTALGGQESSGEGVIVGVIDTGIWPEHPSFSDPDPSGKAYTAPGAAPSGVARACQFSGGATPGDPFTCNNKLIGAYRVLATYDALVGPEPGYTSARDADGHGTHTSSTSAGNAGVAASIFGVSRGTISGIAPRAHVIMYKALGNGGGYSSDLAAAAEQAILDGVNVINFSISGGSNPYSDIVELAFLDAYNAGIFVAASAGNAGPSPDTTDHRGPWVTTVAASTQNRSFVGTATITSGNNTLTLKGTSITSKIGPAPIIVPATADILCDTPFTAGSVTGKIVVCKRGSNGRADKGYNVLQGGAVGMILYNQSAAVTDLETDNHFLPTVHIQYADGQKLLDFLTANPGAVGTLSAGEKTADTGDIMASFSSRGGLGQVLGVSKPDITAPGVQILAGASPAHLDASVDTALGPQGELFQAIAGTSMSSPHIAGAGALIKALHPAWTPGQIKSALMTTATTSVLKEDGITPATVFDDGSGRVDLTKAGDPGLTFDVSGFDYVVHSNDLWNANYPSVFIPSMPGILSVTRVAHSVLSYASTWNLSYQGAFKVTVPPTVSVPAGGDAAFTVAIDASDIAVGDFQSGMLTLTETSGQATHKLHIPISLIRKDQGISLSKTCTSPAIGKDATTTCTITATNNNFADHTVAITDNLPDQLKAVAGTITGANVTSDLKTLTFSKVLGAAIPPSPSIGVGSSPAGYLALVGFGISAIASPGDDNIFNYNVPAFTYAGETYSRLGVTSNGYVVVGGGSGAPAQNQHLPSTDTPNNVIAPWWTDLNPGAGGAIRIGMLNDGADTWIVVDWAAVKEFGAAKYDTFELWIGVNGDAHPGEDISVVYGTLQGNGDGGLLTVGVENRFGTQGSTYYYSNGSTTTGTLPTSATELVTTSSAPVPGETHTITFTAVRDQPGRWVNYAHMTSDLFQGIDVARESVDGQLLFLPQIAQK
jgi:subtilisin family serine protease